MEPNGVAIGAERVAFGLGRAEGGRGGEAAAPGGRHAGEWLSRLGKGEVRSLLGVARAFVKWVAPAVVAHEAESRGVRAGVRRRDGDRGGRGAVRERREAVRRTPGVLAPRGVCRGAVGERAAAARRGGRGGGSM